MFIGKICETCTVMVALISSLVLKIIEAFEVLNRIFGKLYKYYS